MPLSYYIFGASAFSKCMNKQCPLFLDNLTRITHPTLCRMIVCGCDSPGVNNTLISLNLSWNHIRQKGAEAIANGLKVSIISYYCNVHGNDFSTGWSRPTFFPAGGLGRCKPPAGFGAEPRRQADFDNNRLKIN